MNRKNLVTLVHSLIASKVDYCNSLLIRLPNVILKRVQSVLNRTASTSSHPNESFQTVHIYSEERGRETYMCSGKYNDIYF